MLLTTRMATLLLACLVAPAVLAQPAPLSAERMWGLQRLGEPAMSPDGRLAVVPVTRYDVAENKGFTDLWLIPVAGGPPASSPATRPRIRSRPSAPTASGSPSSPSAAEDKQTQVYVIAADGGEARRVTNVPTGADVPKWFPDSRRIAFVTADLDGPGALGRPGASACRSGRSPKMTARVWDRAPIAYWDHLLDDREPHLSSRSTSTAASRWPSPGCRASRCRGRRWTTYSYDISPDGHRSRLRRERGQERRGPELRRHRAARLRLQAGEEPDAREPGGRRRAALQPGRALARLHAAADQAVSMRDRARLMLLRPQRRHDPRPHRETGTAP